MSKTVGAVIYILWCLGVGVVGRWIPVDWKVSFGFLAGALAIIFLRHYNL